MCTVPGVDLVEAWIVFLVGLHLLAWKILNYG